MRSILVVASVSVLALSACSDQSAEQDIQDTTPTGLVAIPESLAPFGDGYPNSGDPCRRLGESAATSDYLDDSATLIGCPSDADAEALGAQVVGNIEGIRLVSVPMEDANAGMTDPVDAPSVDAKVAGTDYNATTIVKCGFENNPPTQSCDAGIKRNWGEPREHLIEVTKPDGSKRAIFFRGTKPYGADSAQADGSAGWDFKSTRSGDQTTIRFGPETYVVVDAMIEGG